MTDVVSIKNKKVKLNLDAPEHYEKSIKILEDLKKECETISNKCKDAALRKEKLPDMEILWDEDETYGAKCYSVEWDDIFYIKYYTPKYRNYFPDFNMNTHNNGDIWVTREQFWLSIDDIPSMYRAKLTFA